jgi:hypothetical protein
VEFVEVHDGLRSGGNGMDHQYRMRSAPRDPGAARR